MTPTTKLFLIIFFFPQSIFPLVITISLYSWFSSDVTKILSPKPQGLLSFNLRLVKCLLKINFSTSFKVIAFSVLKISIALSNFSSLLRVTLKKKIWRPRKPSHMLKETILLHDIVSFEW